MPAAASLRRLLIVDPCPECLRLLPELQDAGWTVASCALEVAHLYPCDVGLLRLQLAHLRRPEAVRALIGRSDSEWIAVLSTDELRVPNYGEFVCEGFFDFHTLPFDVPRMQVALGRAFGMARLRGRSSPRSDEAGHELLGESRVIRELRTLLGKLAPTESPVLIRGERGTGKALVAHTLHRLSPRHGQPFITFNCRTTPAHLLRAELFGSMQEAGAGRHEHTVGRIEAAHGGTLLLDEVAELPLLLQADLLRFLQEKRIERAGGNPSVAVDVRVLAATHVDLEQAIAQGRMREDLYYRLNVLQVTTAPLRERHGDLSLLASHFARRYSLEHGRRPRGFSDSALAAMGRYEWPGNVRELAQRVRRSLVLAEGGQIEAHDLGLADLQLGEQAMMTLEEYKHQAERQALHDVLGHHAGNMTLAARVLGISRPTFYRLLHKHQLL